MDLLHLHVHTRMLTDGDVEAMLDKKTARRKRVSHSQRDTCPCRFMLRLGEAQAVDYGWCIMSQASILDSVWPGIIFGSLELNLKAFHADLEAVHGLNGCLRGGRVVEADEPEALALVRRPIDEHFGTDHVTKWQEHLHQLGIPELLRQMVDEEVATVRSFPLSQLVRGMQPPAAPHSLLCYGRFTTSNEWKKEKRIKERQDKHRFSSLVTRETTHLVAGETIPV